MFWSGGEFWHIVSGVEGSRVVRVSGSLVFDEHLDFVDEVSGLIQNLLHVVMLGHFCRKKLNTLIFFITNYV